ncbi:MAG: YihY/virulence factor BrkB family protein [Candidatus Saccharimonadales bacterium]
MHHGLAAFRTTFDKIDLYQRHHKRIGFLYAVIKKYQEDEAGRRSALFTYYGFLALFPFLLVLTSLLRLLLNGNSQISRHIMNGAITYFPIIGENLQLNIHSNKTGLVLVIALLLSLFGARGVADVLRNSLEHIWQVPHKERSNFPGSIFRSLGIIVVGGLGLILAPVLAGYTLVFSDSIFFRFLSILISLIVLFWVLVFVIKMSLSVHRSLREVWVGAAVAAICLAILQSLGGYIVARELRNLNDLYGTFAIILGMLYWIYLQAQVIFYVFELDSVRILRLWPRSMHKPFTNADYQAFQLYKDRAKFQDIVEPEQANQKLN